MTSSIATLTVLTFPPVITKQPTNVTAIETTVASLSVVGDRLGHAELSMVVQRATACRQNHGDTRIPQRSIQQRRKLFRHHHQSLRRGDEFRGSAHGESAPALRAGA